MDDFPKRLRKLRGNLSQRKFAELIGVTHQRVSDYEKGKVQPTLEFFELIEKNLNLNTLTSIISYLTWGFGVLGFCRF